MKKLVLSFYIFAFISGLQASASANEQKVERLKIIVEKRGWYLGCREINEELRGLGSLIANTQTWEDEIFVKAGCLSETRRDPEAITILKAALKTRPGSGRLWDMLGTSYLRIGQDDDAINSLTEALKTREGGSIHSKLAISYQRKGAILQGVNKQAERVKLLDLAEKHVRRAMELDNLPNSPIRYSELAHIKLAKGEYREAIGLFEQAIERVPNNQFWDEKMISTAYAEYYMAMGQTYYISGDKGNGIDYMDLAKEKAPTDELTNIMASMMDSTINAAQSANELKRKKPELGLPSFIPLDEQ